MPPMLPMPPIPPWRSSTIPAAARCSPSGSPAPRSSVRGPGGGTTRRPTTTPWRAPPPYLAFVDCDVFWLSRDLWPWLAGELDHPGVAAVACVSRHDRRSHGTFAVVFKTEVYREVLAGLPGGFSPAVTGLDLAAE